MWVTPIAVAVVAGALAGWVVGGRSAPAADPSAAADANAEAAMKEATDSLSDPIAAPDDVVTMAGVVPGTAFRGRFARAAAQAEGATRTTEAAVAAALRWLAAHRSPDGRWEARGF